MRPIRAIAVNKLDFLRVAEKAPRAPHDRDAGVSRRLTGLTSRMLAAMSETCGAVGQLLIDFAPPGATRSTARSSQLPLTHEAMARSSAPASHTSTVPATWRKGLVGGGRSRPARATRPPCADGAGMKPEEYRPAV
jgi:hypothetical protein